MDRHLVGSTYGKFCIKFPQNKKKGERHRLSQWASSLKFDIWTLIIIFQLKDLFRFIGILFVFMIGVGVLYHSNMYPAHYDLWNNAGWTYWRMWKIISIPYWQIYGEPNLEIFEGNYNNCIWLNLIIIRDTKSQTIRNQNNLKVAGPKKPDSDIIAKIG